MSVVPSNTALNTKKSESNPKALPNDSNEYSDKSLTGELKSQCLCAKENVTNTEDAFKNSIRSLQDNLLNLR